MSCRQNSAILTDIKRYVISCLSLYHYRSYRSLLFKFSTLLRFLSHPLGGLGTIEQSTWVYADSNMRLTHHSSDSTVFQPPVNSSYDFGLCAVTSWSCDELTGTLNKQHFARLFSESMNNILKTVADWKQLPASSVINNVHDIVRVQYCDIRWALYGQGNFVLSPTFSRHTVPYTVWSTSDDAQKDRLVSRFIRDNGQRQGTTNVVSSDGVTKTTKTARTAKKPGQRARPRQTRSTIKKDWQRYARRPVVCACVWFRCL